MVEVNAFFFLSNPRRTETIHLFSFFPTCGSKFGDIFDEDFFIQALSKHVNIVRELPADVLQQYDNNISSIVNLRVKAWSSPMYYLRKVLPKLLQLRYVFLVLK